MAEGQTDEQKENPIQEKKLQPVMKVVFLCPKHA